MNVVDESALKYLGRCRVCGKHLFLENCNVAPAHRYGQEEPATGPAWLEHMRGDAWSGRDPSTKVRCLKCVCPSINFGVRRDPEVANAWLHSFFNEKSAPLDVVKP